MVFGGRYKSSKLKGRRFEACAFGGWRMEVRGLRPKILIINLKPLKGLPTVAANRGRHGGRPYFEHSALSFELSIFPATNPLEGYHESGADRRLDLKGWQDSVKNGLHLKKGYGPFDQIRTIFLRVESQFSQTKGYFHMVISGFILIGL